jgi:hypothetical protein
MSDQILSGLLAGLFGGLVVFLFALLKKRIKCGQCGFVLPRFRTPKNLSQAADGGITCPQCHAELDRKGRRLNDASVSA